MIDALLSRKWQSGDSGFSPLLFPYCYVGFVDRTEIRILRFVLKRGFRHCFIIMGDEERCIVIDPISNRIDVSYFPLDVRVVRKMLMRSSSIGATFVRIRRRYVPNVCVSSGIFTCVEVVKRILGISKFSVFTPFRLYKLLKK